MFPFILFYHKQMEKLIIPEYSEKRIIIKRYKKLFDLKVLIETGTFLGETIDTFKDEFDQLISFELSEELATKAKEKFKKHKHINIITGDSGKLMVDILKEIQQPCLFWLDGHYSSEFFIGKDFIKTAKGEKETPIIEELTTIFNHSIDSHVVLIDDARCFNGKNDYPTLGELKKLIHDLSPNSKVVVKRDILRITPK